MAPRIPLGVARVIQAPGPAQGPHLPTQCWDGVGWRGAITCLGVGRGCAAQAPSPERGPGPPSSPTFSPSPPQAPQPQHSRSTSKVQVPWG